MSSASLTTWALVRIRPLAVTITPEPLAFAMRSLGSPYPGENGSEKNGSGAGGLVSTMCDDEMLTTLSKTRSATSGIELSVSNDGDTGGAGCAGCGPRGSDAQAHNRTKNAGVGSSKLRGGILST